MKICSDLLPPKMEMLWNEILLNRSTGPFRDLDVWFTTRSENFGLSSHLTITTRKRQNGCDSAADQPSGQYHMKYLPKPEPKQHGPLEAQNYTCTDRLSP